MDELREIAKFLDREVQKFSEKAFSDIKSDAPLTTPDFSNFEVWFGKSSYKKTVTNLTMIAEHQMSHVDFLEAIMATYLRDETSIDLQNYESELEGVDNLGWDEDIGGQTKGSHNPAMDVIWMQFLPSDTAHKLGEGIASNFSSEIAKHLKNFPVDYSKNNYIWSGNSNIHDFKETFAHELTHFYATTNTKLGDLKREGAGYYDNPADLPIDEFMEYMENEEHRENMQDQAASIGADESVLAIEEIFSHFISSQYVDRREISSQYSRNQYIEWGLKIVKEKASAENTKSKVDWAREEMRKVLNDIAQRGMLKKDGDTRDILVLFLKRMMPQKDRKRMNYMRQIAEGDLSTAYSDLHQALNDIERMERDRGRKEAFDDFRSFEQEVDWDNPREIEDIVLHGVLEEAVGNLSLSETEKLLRKKISEEVQNLEKLVEKAKTLEQEVKDKEGDQELVTALRELSQAEQEVAQLT